MEKIKIFYGEIPVKMQFGIINDPKPTDQGYMVIYNILIKLLIIVNGYLMY